MGSDVLAAALELCDKNLAVHWLRNPNKLSSEEISRGLFKAPISENWSKIEKNSCSKLSKTYRSGYGVGLRTGMPSEPISGYYLYVIDVDIRVAKVKYRVNKLLLDFLQLKDWSNYPRVLSGSGGDSFHIYFLSDKIFSTHKILKSEKSYIEPETGKKRYEWEIELLANGKQVVLPPTYNPISGENWKWIEPIDWDRLDDLDYMSFSDEVEKKLQRQINVVGKKTSEASSKRLGLTLDQAERIFNEIEGDTDEKKEEFWDDRDEWIRAGMALHHEYAGTELEDEAKELWDHLASISPKFEQNADTQYEWDSFVSDKDSPVTMATYRKMYYERSGKPLERVEDMFSERKGYVLGENPNNPQNKEVDFDFVHPRQKVNPDKTPEEAKDFVKIINSKFAKIPYGKGYGYVDMEHTDFRVIDRKSLLENWENKLIVVDGKTVSCGPHWCKDEFKREYKYTDFVPGKYDLGENTYNFWEGYTVEPEKGDVSVFENHILHVLCSGNLEISRYVIQWFSHIFKKPTQQPSISLIVKGGQGHGKDTVADLIGSILGPQHHVVFNGQNDLLNKFNSRLEKAMLIQGKEVTFAGDKRLHEYLKGRTDGKNIIEVERKGQDKVSVKNYARYYLTTNSDHILPAEADERRFIILKSDNKYIKDNPQHLKDLMKLKSKKGLSNLLYYLQNYDLKGFNPYEIIETEELRYQKKISLRGFDSWLQDVKDSLQAKINFEGIHYLLEDETGNRLALEVPERSDIVKVLGKLDEMYAGYLDVVACEGYRRDKLRKIEFCNKLREKGFDIKSVRILGKKYKYWDLTSIL